MRVFFCLLVLTVPIFISAQLKEGLNHSTICITPAGQAKYDVNAIIWLPPGYSDSKKYPLVFYGHGAGQAGTDLNLLYTDGLPAVLKAGYQPPFECIIVCPQRQFYGVMPDWLPGMLEDARKRFNIDTTRIYLTGTSAGGYLCYGSQLNISGELARKFAAICVISGATQDANQNNLGWWASSKTPLWAIIGSEDHTFAHQNIFLTNAINQKAPGTARISIRPGVGHGGWTEVYNGSFTESGQNIWDWLYGFKTGPATHASPGGAPYRKRINLIIRDSQVYCTNIAREYDPQPGDTLVVPTGILSFSIQNFSGTKKRPIVIVPKDSGWIGGYKAFGAAVSKAKFFKLTGFHIDGLMRSSLGMAIGFQTTDYEVSHCHIKNIQSIGLLAKQDPGNSPPGTSWPEFSIRNVSIHDIVVRNTGTEGLYLGYTFDIVTPLAPPLVNLKVYNISVDSTGWDGVQFSNCQDVKLHDIDIRNYGLKDESGQQAGLLLGGMVTLGDIASDVRVSNGTGPGLLIFGRGVMKFNNFRLTRVGMSPGQNAIYISDYKDLGYDLPPLQLFITNTIVKGSAGNALVVVNTNKSMKMGKLVNFSFSGTRAGIQDTDNIFTADLPLHH